MAHLVISMVDCFSSCMFCDEDATGYIFIEELGILRAYCGNHLDGMVNHYLDQETPLYLSKVV